MTDPNYLEDDDQANGITYRIDIETRNARLNSDQREALRRAVAMALLELNVKMQLVAGDARAVRVTGYIDTTNTGAREIVITEEITEEAANAPEMFSIGGVSMKD